MKTLAKLLVVFFSMLGAYVMPLLVYVLITDKLSIETFRGAALQIFCSLAALIVGGMNLFFVAEDSNDDKTNED